MEYACRYHHGYHRSRRNWASLVLRSTAVLLQTDGGLCNHHVGFGDADGPGKCRAAPAMEDRGKGHMKAQRHIRRQPLARTSNDANVSMCRAMNLGAGKLFLLLLLVSAAAFAQSNQGKKPEPAPAHGEILWQFDTKG